jgi:hypothetical protein
MRFKLYFTAMAMLAVMADYGSANNEGAVNHSENGNDKKKQKNISETIIQFICDFVSNQENEVVKKQMISYYFNLNSHANRNLPPYNVETMTAMRDFLSDIINIFKGEDSKFNKEITTLQSLLASQVKGEESKFNKEITTLQSLLASQVEWSLYLQQSDEDSSFGRTSEYTPSERAYDLTMACKKVKEALKYTLGNEIAQCASSNFNYQNYQRNSTRGKKRDRKLEHKNLSEAALKTNVGQSFQAASKTATLPKKKTENNIKSNIANIDYDIVWGNDGHPADIIEKNRIKQSKKKMEGRSKLTPVEQQHYRDWMDQWSSQDARDAYLEAQRASEEKIALDATKSFMAQQFMAQQNKQIEKEKSNTTAGMDNVKEDAEKPLEATKNNAQIADASTGKSSLNSSNPNSGSSDPSDSDLINSDPKDE